MFIDLDNFKHYNDTYGHDVGDLVLKEMADIFSGLCEKQGFVCRYGGDEYIIVFFTADKERLKETAKQIYQKIDQADGFEKAISEKLKKQISIRKEQRISCSIGIVLAEDIHGEEEINQMIKRADDLLYSGMRHMQSADVCVIPCYTAHRATGTSRRRRNRSRSKKYLPKRTFIPLTPGSSTEP